MGKKALSAERIAVVLGAANCRVYKGGIVQLDDVGSAIAFQKTVNAKGQSVETLSYSNNDQIALDYKMIQRAIGTDYYDIYPRQEVFNKFLKT